MQLTHFEAGNHAPLFLIAGPCVVETETLAVDTAGQLKAVTDSLGIPFIFKSSFDKANRSSHESPRGPGIAEGLRVLESVKRQVGVPVLTDVHEDTPLGEVASVVDVLQTPAFLCRQTNFIVNVSSQGLPVNIKKGQFLAPHDMTNVVAKARSTGNRQIMVCERGASFGYNNLVSDMRGLAIMRQTGAPVVFDATHSVQMPGGLGSHFGRPAGDGARAGAAVSRGRRCGGSFHGDPPGSGKRALGRTEQLAAGPDGRTARAAQGARHRGQIETLSRRRVARAAGGRVNGQTHKRADT